MTTEVMTTAEFYKELDSALNFEPGTIKGNEKLTDLSGWDSMAILIFIDMVSLKLGLIVKVAELTKCQTVADLIKVCEGRVRD